MLDFLQVPILVQSKDDITATRLETTYYGPTQTLLPLFGDPARRDISLIAVCPQATFLNIKTHLNNMNIALHKKYGKQCRASDHAIEFGYTKPQLAQNGFFTVYMDVVTNQSWCLLQIGNEGAGLSVIVISSDNLCNTEKENRVSLNKTGPGPRLAADKF